MIVSQFFRHSTWTKTWTWEESVGPAGQCDAGAYGTCKCVCVCLRGNSRGRQERFQYSVLALCHAWLLGLFVWNNGHTGNTWTHWQMISGSQTSFPEVISHFLSPKHIYIAKYSQKAKKKKKTPCGSYPIFSQANHGFLASSHDWSHHVIPFYFSNTRSWSYCKQSNGQFILKKYKFCLSSLS